jgi:hypothetical protein
LHFTPGSHEVLYVPKAGHDDIQPIGGERIGAMELRQRRASHRRRRFPPLTRNAPVPVIVGAGILVPPDPSPLPPCPSTSSFPMEKVTEAKVVKFQK